MEELRVVPRAVASAWARSWHYLGRAGEATSRHFALFRDGSPIAVVSVGRPPNVHGPARSLGISEFRGGLEINRVVCDPLAPRMTTTHAIALVLHVLASEGEQWCYSMADSAAGHHGGIYQALNGVYVGLRGGGTFWKRGRTLLHGRQATRLYGGNGRAGLRRAELINDGGWTILRLGPTKHTYVFPLGTPHQRRKIRQALEPVRLPYPKRVSLETSPTGDVSRE